MAFETELNSLFGQLAAQPVVENHPVNVALEGVVAPVTPPAPAPVVEPPKAEPAPVVVAPVVAPAATAPVAPVIDPDAVIENWDAPESPVVAPVVSPDGNLSEIAKALGLEGKTKEEVINAVTALKVKAEAQGPVLPDDLARAVEIAKQGGPYLDYLKVSGVDWAKADPVILFQDWVYDRFAKSGKTAEEIEAYLDKIDDLDKEIRGIELQNQYIQYQQNQKLQIENQVKFEKQERDSLAKRALDHMDVVFGFKLGLAHKEELFNEFSNTPIGRALLSQSGGDYKKALERLFLSKYGEKVDAIRRKQLKDLSKRELLAEITNPKITSPSELPLPNTVPLDPIATYLSELKQTKGL